MACAGTRRARCWSTQCRLDTGEGAQPGARTLRQAQDEPCTGVIDHILDADRQVPRKQRRAAESMFERVRDGYDFTGRYTISKDCVREHSRRNKEMFVPLSHPPGHTQRDFDESWWLSRVEQKAHC